jgi:hypothetical protein
MEVKQSGLGSVLLDSDYSYLSLLYAIIRHSDAECHVNLTKVEDEMFVAITPSQQDFKQHIIENLLFGHRLLGMKIYFSKSLAIQKSVCYTIKFGS